MIFKVFLNIIKFKLRQLWRKQKQLWRNVGVSTSLELVLWPPGKEERPLCAPLQTLIKGIINDSIIREITDVFSKDRTIFMLMF